MSAQEEFDKKYMSTTEVCLQLKVHRTTVLLALRTGRLPDAIVLRRPNGEPQVMIWERETIQPYLTEWAANRAQRAGA